MKWKMLSQRQKSLDCGTIHPFPFLDYSMIMDVSEVLKALADPNRLRILNLLHERKLFAFVTLKQSWNSTSPT